MLKEPKVFKQTTKEAYERYLLKYPNDGISYSQFCKAIFVYNKEMMDRAIDGQIVELQGLKTTLLINKVKCSLKLLNDAGMNNTVRIIKNNELDPYLYTIKVIPNWIKFMKLYKYGGTPLGYTRLFRHCKKINNFPYISWDLNMFKKK